jgi:hypothetical protein
MYLLPLIVTQLNFVLCYCDHHNQAEYVLYGKVGGGGEFWFWVAGIHFCFRTSKEYLDNLDNQHFLAVRSNSRSDFITPITMFATFHNEIIFLILRIIPPTPNPPAGGPPPCPLSMTAYSVYLQLFSCWIDLAQGRHQWRSLVNMVVNLWVVKI